MTTRDATPMLTRSGDVGVSRDHRDWALLLAFGAIQWPWLLKSLYGGRKRDKAALLARLDLPGDALPNLGSWKADTGLLHRIVDAIAASRPATVVELGAGASTLVAAKALVLSGGGRLVSFDQHADFVMATRRWLADHAVAADLRHAPLVTPTGRWRDLWYDLDGVPDTIDLLLIDGPPWTIHPMVRARAECLFDRIPPGGMVILDDAARPGERLVAAGWKARWPQFDWSFEPTIKGNLIGVRRS
jgi:predicted O-methyltransferase YrrM